MAETKSKLSLVMEMVDKITTPISKVTEQTKKSATVIDGYQKDLSKLSKQAGDIEAFRTLKMESLATSRAIREQQQKVTELARAMAATDKPTRAMTAEFNRAKREAQQLTNTQQKQADKLTALRTKLNESGISTKNLRNETAQLSEKTKRLNAQMEKEKKNLQEIAEREKKLGAIRDKNSKLMSSAAMDTAKIGASVFALKQLTDSYGEVASAQGQIQSLGIGAEGIEKITKAAQDFSNQWAGTTTAEFITASYDIKSGIASLSDAAVGEFTKIAALTGTATKSSTAEMTNLFASGYGIYRKQFETFGKETIKNWETLSAEEKDIEFGKYFSAGISSTVKAFKTSGPQMSAAISALGASATAANVPFSEQLSIMGQLQSTMSGSEAATKYKAFLGAAAGAADKLGLNFMDANNQLLSMPSILEELKGKYGETLDAMEQKEIKDAFGTDEAKALILQLYPEIDTLKTNIDSMTGSVKKGMDATTEMATAIATGPNESIALMSQRVGNLAATLGEIFAPMLMFITDKIGKAAMLLSNFAQEWPILTQLIGGVVMALIMLKTTLIAVKVAQIAMNMGMLISIQRATYLGYAHKALAIGTKAMAGAQWLLNAAMTANPIGIVIAAVAGLCALAYTFIDDWSPVTDFFKSMVGGMLTYINALLHPLDTLKNIWASIFGDDEPVTKAIDVSKTVQTSFSGSSNNAASATPQKTIAANHLAPANYASSNEITINQQPGESGEDVALRVRQELDKRDREKARNYRERLYD